MQAVKFLKKLLLLLPIVLAMVAVNYVIDPACLFKGESFYRQMASIMLNGHNIANLSENDDRLLLKYYIEGLRKPKEIMAFGTSRILLLDSSMLRGHSFFNNGVIGGCCIEDHMAIYWMYHKKGLIPTYAILDLDPWLMDKNNPLIKATSIIDQYNEMMIFMHGKSDRNDVRLMVVKDDIRKIKELFSPSYFRASTTRWKNDTDENKWKGEMYYPTERMLGTGKIKRADGSLGYEEAFRHSTPELVHFRAMTESAYDFDEMSQANESKLEDLIDLMQRDGVKLIIFLPEYNPAAYTRLKRAGKLSGIEGAERFYRTLATRKHIRVIGSFDPDRSGLKEIDFIDGVHAKDYIIRRYFKPGLALFK